MYPRSHEPGWLKLQLSEMTKPLQPYNYAECGTRMSINKAIDAHVRCLKCGTPGVGKCDCWEFCTCGYIIEKGKICHNPNTRGCSLKVKYGKYNKKTKRYE